MHRRVHTTTIARSSGFYLWHQWQNDRRIAPGMRFSPASPGPALPIIVR